VFDKYGDCRENSFEILAVVIVLSPIFSVCGSKAFVCILNKGIFMHTQDILNGTTDQGDRTLNNYDCQNFQQVFTAVPVHIKHVFLGVPKFSHRLSRESAEPPALKTESRKTG